MSERRAMANRRRLRSKACLVLSCLIAPACRASSEAAEVPAPLDAEIAAVRPVVVHVVVALCDNANQGIVPVPPALGNGQDPRTNLYWGARYGLRTYFQRDAGWRRWPTRKPADPRILDRVVLTADLKRGTATVPVYVVADAWDGARIRDAIQAFLKMAAGHAIETVDLPEGAGRPGVSAGGSAQLLVYVGHNGLMEFSVEGGGRERDRAEARDAMVLACASKPYFLDRLREAGARPLLLTTGLMAPEAYTLDAAIRSWVDGGATAEVGDAAAGAYDRYQKCGLRAARRLFWGAP